MDAAIGAIGATVPLYGLLTGGDAPVTDPAVLTALATACRHRERARFAYAAADGTPSRRHAEPYRLVSADRRWYLFAYDLDRADWRTFRADRIAAPRATGARPPRTRPRSSPSPSSAAAPGTGRWSPCTPPSRTPPASSCLLRTGGDAPDWLAVRLGLLGVPFEVHEPPELIAYLRDLGTRLFDASHGAPAPPGREPPPPPSPNRTSSAGS